MSKYECPSPEVGGCGGGFEKPAWNEDLQFIPACPWCGKKLKYLSGEPK